MLNEEKDAPVAAMRIAVPDASVKIRRKNTFLFWQKDYFFSTFLTVINGS